MAKINERFLLVSKKCTNSYIEFSDRVGITTRCYYSYIKDTEPKLSAVLKVIDEFDVNPEWLLFGTPPMFRYEIKPSSCSDFENVEHESEDTQAVNDLNSEYLRAASRENDHLKENLSNSAAIINELRAQVNSLTAALTDAAKTNSSLSETNRLLMASLLEKK